MTVKALKTPDGGNTEPRFRRTVRARAGIDLVALAEYAGLHTPVADAAALMGVADSDLQALLDDPASEPARIWRTGRAQARLNVRRAQFAHLEKTASIAVHLGRELLGQDGGGPGGPVTFVVDTGIRRADG